jgi:arabinoxylan arabinofuranohydrolase
MAGAELNDDLTSLKPGTTQVMTPDATFREGAYAFCRNGTYYFLWSEDDTRSPNYQVRYGTSATPLGKMTVPANNLVLKKDPAAGIYGTGHNSVIQVPGRDEWYIVYHRFTYPQGLTMGDAAGFHREVCIDKLEFNPDGSLKPVQPTHAGIQPVKVK